MECFGVVLLAVSKQSKTACICTLNIYITVCFNYLLPSADEIVRAGGGESRADPSSSFRSLVLKYVSLSSFCLCK